MSFGVALFVGILILPFVIAVLFAVMGSVKPRLLRCSTGFLLIVLNVSAFVFALLNLIYGIIAVVSSDFCVDRGGPDQTLLDFLQTDNAEIVTYYDYYLKCQGTSFFEGDFNAAQNALSSAATSLRDFKADYAEGYQGVLDGQNVTVASALDEQCLPVFELTDTITNSSIPSVGLAVTSLGNLLDCNSLTPIYQGLVHDTTCKGFCDAFVWMWITSITLVFGVLLMNTFRRAMYDDIIGNADEAADLTLKESGMGYTTESESDSECHEPSPRLSGSSAPTYHKKSKPTTKSTRRSKR